MFQFSLLLLEVILLLSLWIHVHLMHSGQLQSYFQRHLQPLPVSKLLPVVNMLLGVWLALALCFLLPSVYRFLRRLLGHPVAASAGGSKTTRSSQRFWMWVYLMSTWTRMLVMGLSAWFLVLVQMQLVGLIQDMSYAPEAAQVRYLQEMYDHSMTAVSLDGVCVGLGWIQQNFVFYQLGSMAAY